MNLEIDVGIHNKFKIVVRNSKTNQVELEGRAENILTNRIYTRLCNFQSYFANIVFGTGTGTPSPGKDTLFTRLGSKSATTESTIIGFPTSIWTRKIVLGTEEFNENIITEVGISDHATNINTHAMITDAEGSPLNIEKNSLRIIEIYATVYVSIYDVDPGLYYYNNILRNYMLGGSAPSNELGISNADLADIKTITGTRTVDATAKTVEVKGRFNVGDLNKDVRFLYWSGLGLVCEVPRVGVYQGTNVNDDLIGIGDGSNKDFDLGRSPNTPIENLVVFVDGTSKSFTYDQETNIVTMDEAPGDTLQITASYKSNYFPKTEDNVLDIGFKIKYDVSQPSPVIPIPPAVIPGAETPIAGDADYGFFGEVPSEEFINGEKLATMIRLTAGTAQNSDISWLKFALDGKILFVPKKTLRHTISWNHINTANAVFGDEMVQIRGHKYKIRLMKTGLTDPMSATSGDVLHGSEWNKLMLPIHIQAKDGSWAYPNNVEAEVPYWETDYTDIDLNLVSASGNGYYTWCQETYSSNRLGRGRYGVSYSGYNTPSIASANMGWRPVLELVPEL